MNPKCIAIAAVALLLWGGAGWAAGAPETALHAPEAAEQAPAKELSFDIEDKPLDRAGEAVGKGIEKIGDSAAAKVGHWITTEAIYDIRWLTNIGITYDTPLEKVTQAVGILEDFLADHEGLHPDFPPRVYFNGFKDWSLNIMVLLWYHPANYWDFQDFIQRTCLAILGRFREAGIDLAFPSQTVCAAGDDKRLLKMMLAGAEGAPVEMPEA